MSQIRISQEQQFFKPYFIPQIVSVLRYSCLVHNSSEYEEVCNPHANAITVSQVLPLELAIDHPL
jgi:hypothetical protein